MSKSVTTGNRDALPWSMASLASRHDRARSDAHVALEEGRTISGAG